MNRHRDDYKLKRIRSVLFVLARFLLHNCATSATNCTGHEHFPNPRGARSYVHRGTCIWLSLRGAQLGTLCTGNDAKGGAGMLCATPSKLLMLTLFHYGPPTALANWSKWEMSAWCTPARSAIAKSSVHFSWSPSVGCCSPRPLLRSFLRRLLGTLFLNPFLRVLKSSLGLPLLVTCYIYLFSYIYILPVRSHYFSTYFSLFFHVLFGTLLGEHFWRPKCRPILQKSIFWNHLGFPGVTKMTLGTTILPLWAKRAPNGG